MGNTWKDLKPGSIFKYSWFDGNIKNIIYAYLISANKNELKILDLVNIQNPTDSEDQWELDLTDDSLKDFELLEVIDIIESPMDRLKIIKPELFL